MFKNEYTQRSYEVRKKVKRDETTMREIFANNCDLSDVEITDKIAVAFGFGDDWLACCDYIDTYVDLRETYQTLMYHFELYKQGQTRKYMFINVCNWESVKE